MKAIFYIYSNKLAFRCSFSELKLVFTCQIDRLVGYAKLLLLAAPLSNIFEVQIRLKLTN